MGGMQVLLEVMLLGLLAATLFHAMRLERALGVLKRDRANLEALVAGFNDSTRQAESGVAKLKEAADGAGRHIARQIEASASIKQDLLYLTERGEQLADRLDAVVRQGRAVTASLKAPPASSATAHPETTLPAGSASEKAPAGTEPNLRTRSQAEHELLRALKLAK